MHLPKVLKIALFYVLTVFAFFFLDNLPDIARGNKFLERLNFASLLYQWAATAGFKKPLNNNTALVLIDKKAPEYVKNNICIQRKYLADVLRRVRDAPPAVIAIDIWFSPDTCPAATDLYQGTAELQRAISEVSQTIPVVIGQSAIDAASLANEAPGNLEALEKRGLKDTEVILEPSVDFGTTQNNKISLGLVALNEDLRKVPLGWPTYSSLDMVGHETPKMVDSFSVAVTKAFRPDPKVLSKITAFQDSGRDPLTSFLPEREILCFSSSDVLASSLPPNDDQDRCRPNDTLTSPLAQLAHRVVVIGKDDPLLDRHESVIGEVPGVILQANYIESTLTANFLKAVHGWRAILVALVWLGLIEVIFRLLAAHPHWAFAIAILATVAVWVILYDLLLMQWGYYLVLWPPSIVAILWRYVLTLSERATQLEA